MAVYEVTLNSEQLSGLLTSDTGLQGLVETVLNQVLDAQVSEQIGALPYERSPERRAYRNGSRLRTLYTRVGPLVLRVPQVRDGCFSTELFARYQRSEQALVLAMMEMVFQAVSTRKVAKVTEELCGSRFSRSTVSQLCTALDARVTAWNERPLGTQLYPSIPTARCDTFFPNDLQENAVQNQGASRCHRFSSAMPEKMKHRCVTSTTTCPLSVVPCGLGAIGYERYLPELCP